MTVIQVRCILLTALAGSLLASAGIAAAGADRDGEDRGERTILAVMADPASPGERSAVPDVAAEPEAEAKKAIETITITARKREEDLQKSPVSVTALTASTIDSRSITYYRELGDMIPNLTLSTSTGPTAGMSLTSRGALSPDAILTEDTAVGVYIDGVYMGKNLGQAFEMVDIERVEMLRGPQGTLYGRNTLGGALNIITRRPTGEWGGRAKIRSGTRSLFNATLGLDFPVIGENGFSAPSVLGELAGKATFNFVSQAPFFNNDVPGAPKGFRDMERYAGLFSLRSTNFLVEGLVIDYTFDIHDFDETGPGSQLTLVKARSGDGFGGQAFTLLGLGNCALLMDATGACFAAPPAVFGTPDQIKTDRSSFLSNEAPLRAKFQATGHAITVTYDLSELPVLGDVTLKSITGFRMMEQADSYDFDGTNVTWAHRNVDQDDYMSVQQEIQAVGSTLGGNLSYVVGLFYSSEEGSDRQDFVLLPALIPYCTANPIFCGPLAAAPNLSTTNLAIIDNWSIAPFGQATYTLELPMGELALTAGVRYTHEDRSVVREIRSLEIAGAASQELQPRQRFSTTFGDVAPMGTVSWQATPEHMVYVTVAKGFKSGGFNGRATDAEGFKPYDSEKLLSYELGVKTRWFDDRVQLNAAGFYNDNTDRQVQVFVVNAGSTLSTAIKNAAEVEIWGAEVEILAQPFEGALINFGYGLTLPEYKKFLDTPQPTLGNPTPSPIDVSEYRFFMRTPEHDISVGGSYTLPSFSWGTVMARLDYHWQSEIFFGRTNGDTNPQVGYGLLSARVQISEIEIAGSGSLILGIWGRNLLDEGYREGGSDWGGLGFAQNQYGIGRQYGMDLSIAF